MTQKTGQKTTLKPLGDRVLLKRLENQAATKGGIILPDTAKQKQERAEVIAVGKGKKSAEGKEIPMPVKIGDIVLLDKYSGQEVTLDDQEYLIARADDIIAIVS